MRQLTRKQVIMIVAGVAVLALIIYGFMPTPRDVQTAQVVRAPFQVFVEEEGETRVVDRYQVAAPVAAYARRARVEIGDIVSEGQAIVDLEAPRSGILDDQSRVETSARVEAARAAVVLATEQVRAAEVTARRAAEERDRLQRLLEEDAATPRAVDRAATEAEQAEASLEAARAAVSSARAELVAAESTLRGAPASNVNLPVRTRLVAPAAGRVLAVHKPSGGPVQPGEPLIEIGDTQQLEVRINVLSQDAVRIRPGMPVLIDQWGGESRLEAEVVRVEPQAFTDISALGVEERRVPVIAAITSPAEEWIDLGSNFRVLARFVIWEGAQVLQVPAAAVFRTDDGPAVFVVEGRRAERRLIETGRQSGLSIEVVSGLNEGDVVIIHPDNALEDGDRVRAGR
jgi:HlyD family secretion protein